MNKYSKYINILNIKIFGFTFNLQIGNPMWFIKEIKNTLRKESK